MVEIKATIKKRGNSYFVLIPKDLVDCKVLPEGKPLTFEVKGGATGI